MKYVRFFIPATLAFTLFLTSCVSTRKYEQALEWKTRYDHLKAEYAEVLTEKDQIKQTTLEALKQKEAELREKEYELAAREQKVKELNSMIDQQKDAVLALKQEVCSALKCFTPEELQVEIRNGQLYVSLSDKLLFESGSDEINERGQQAIAMLAAVLQNSDLQIMVEGHTDSVPIHTKVYEDNWDLSVHRATTVAREMMNEGISPKRIIASGRGEHHPVADNTDTRGRQLNRRTEIVLAPKLERLWELTETEVMVQEVPTK